MIYLLLVYISQKLAEIKKEMQWQKVTFEKETLELIDNDVNETSEKTNTAQMFMSPEAKAILESTPELVKSESKLTELDEYQTPMLDISSAQKVNQHNVSLFAEMQQLDSSNLEMGGLKEFDILLSENKELMDVR